MKGKKILKEQMTEEEEEEEEGETKSNPINQEAEKV